MSHIFTSKGIVIDTEKARAVLEMEPPTDVEGVQRLNGVVNFLTKFPPRLAARRHGTNPQTDKKGSKMILGWKAKAALSKVKVTQAPVLSYYNPELPLSIQCDASQKGLGASLP